MKLFIKIIIAFFLLPVFGMGQTNDLALAHAYYKQGEYEKAAELYKNLSTQNNFRQLIHHDYVATLIRMRDYKTAEEFVKSQIAKYNNVIAYKADLAEVYEKSGKTALADKEYETLINTVVGNESEMIQLLNFFNRTRRIDLMVKLILKERQTVKDPYKLDFSLAHAYMYLNRKDMALEEILGYGSRGGNINSVRRLIQDNFVTDEEIGFIENTLLSKIQSEPSSVFIPEILIWWYAQKGEFSRVFIQARALDKRLNQGGTQIFQYAGQAYNGRDFKNSARMYQYIMDEYPEGELYPYARTLLIKSKEEVVKTTFPIEKEAILDLIVQYQNVISDLGTNIRTADAMRNMALLQAFYLKDFEGAIKTLETAVEALGRDPKFRDLCKLDMGDIYLLKDEPWEATLIYMQVEKSQKENDLGQLAKLKNAKLLYYTGQFNLAKDVLDVLKKATSKEISNDAMELSLLIEDNTGLDSTEVALSRYSKVDLLIYQNQYSEAIDSLNILYEDYKDHSLVDEILWLRANTLLKINEIIPSIEDLEAILKNYSYDILGDDALFLLAKVYDENLNQKEKAMEYYRKMLIDYPGSIYGARSRIRFRELRGDFIN